MPSRWFNAAVILMWLCSMSWLLLTKVLPPFRVGDPPSYQSVLLKEHNLPPVCWLIRWRDEPIGWAASRVLRKSDKMIAIEGQVFLERLPLEEMAPGWLGNMLKPLMRQNATATSAITRMDIDPLGRLVGFETKLALDRVEDAIRISGQVDGNKLQMTVAQSGDYIYRDQDRYLPTGALLGDQLMPQAMLPGLRLGQTWTVPVYNPFRSPKNAIEILQAEVESKSSIYWNGETTPALVVVYRSDPGASLASHREARSRMWVREDGLVMKHEMVFFNSPLMFVRLPDELGAEAAAEIGDWGRWLSPFRAAALLNRMAAEK